ncbi:hydroxyacylglutathione hydrolase [Telmatospirillum siberiense]|uniref:Hydroxyacylglutathione hydrolase n=1 Tax=Telmatospirillum siberiense TaxID=382514 RepID=A0A2N3PPF5_9PROT|nr:hydroxyacylglutathione hydrolase [Telmatospirillum siberiense]PKU22295.1 hydroxyacylglutathione hydrolase [Telmatospirillum siberiense]
MSRLQIEQIPVLTDNYVYLLHDPASLATAAVDPAVAEPVEERLAQKGWTLTHILNTHHHGDHTGGNLALKQRYGARIVGARNDSQRIPGIDAQVADGDSFLLGEAAAVVMAVPGHTSGHIAFWFPESHALFCGDTLFALGCGRLFEGTAEQMWSSLLKLRGLPDDTMVYCAHEYTQSNARFARLLERDNKALLTRIDDIDAKRSRDLPTVPSPLAIERATNPFLRADIESVKKGVGLPGEDPIRVFAEIRRRKDAF